LSVIKVDKKIQFSLPTRLTKKNERGQIAIFVALVFQILFLFFAMVVNVGLLVHHKINLQNSVDLAAYYGAMKQAQTMNAIAHVNYQIRQAYKLLMFRYWSLGTGGDDAFRASLNGSPPGEVQTKMSGYFCLGHDPWPLVAPGESYCRSQNVRLNIRLPQTASLNWANGLVNPFFAFQNTVNSAITQTRVDIQRNCSDIKNLNYYALARFVFAWKYDVQNRRKLIMQLGNELSGPSGGKDLDGELISKGVENTLKNNLTAQNKEDIKFHYYNSLGNSQCGASGNENEAPKWLKEIYILPYMMYMNFDCTNTARIEAKVSFVISSFPPAEMESGKPQQPADLASLTQANNALAPYLDEPPGTDPQANLYKSMVGYEKNPWCMSYVGVSAKSQPKIPFSPFGTVTLTARAFAKPFGGSIGPWHKSSWSPQSDFSDGGTEIDKVMPPRHLPGQGMSSPQMPNASGNYSRYVGDQVGYASQMGLWDFGKSINRNRQGPPDYNLAMWNHLFDNNYNLATIGTEGDVLAWSYPATGGGPGQPAPGNWRDLEIASVAPNQFDISYYSIEPDFYKNYLTRFIFREGKDFKFSVRGDYGSKRNNNDQKYVEYSVKDQIKLVNGGTAQPPVNVNVQSYFVRKFDELLTWFQSKTTETHELDPQRFGQCPYPVPDDATPKQTTAGNCIGGGRTGYSVKVVDGNYLRSSNLKLGGENAPEGPLKNPWSDSDLPMQ
jgi:hypothetical protein